MQGIPSGKKGKGRGQMKGSPAPYGKGTLPRPAGYKGYGKGSKEAGWGGPLAPYPQHSQQPQQQQQQQQRPRPVVAPLEACVAALVEAAGTDAQRRAAVEGGLQAPVYWWTHIEPRTAEPPPPDSSRNEAAMCEGLVEHLTASGIRPCDIAVATWAKKHADHLRLSFPATTHFESTAVDLPQAADPAPAAETPPPRLKWLVLSTVSAAVLTKPALEGNLAAYLTLAKEAGACVVVLSSTAFVRVICGEEAPQDPSLGISASWAQKWRAALAALRGASFTVSGTSDVVAGCAGAHLPLCCPRHPSVREEAGGGEPFPAAFCPYPCLAPADNCPQKQQHLCTRPCHAGPHRLCQFPNPIRLACGHTNQANCGEEPNCGNSVVQEMGCSHEEVVGWDEVGLKVKHGVVKHKMRIPCGKAAADVKCDHPTTVVCSTCGADRVVKCFEYDRDKNDVTAAGPCLSCLSVRRALFDRLRSIKLAEREERRLAKERESLKTRMHQVEAAKKGIFVEGQRVTVADAAHAQDPAKFLQTFGERAWITGKHASAPYVPQRGYHGTIRGRSSHPDELSTLVYLIETHGQEYFILSGKGLQLTNVVSEIPISKGAVLRIEGPGREDVSPGDHRVYHRQEATGADASIFDPAVFSAAADAAGRSDEGSNPVRKHGAAAFYTPERPPPAGAVLRVVSRDRHPDGSNVFVCLLRDVSNGPDTQPGVPPPAAGGKGGKGQPQPQAGTVTKGFLLCQLGPNFKTPYSFGQKVLIGSPVKRLANAMVQWMFPDIPKEKWCLPTQRAAKNDTATIMGMAADPSDRKMVAYLVKLDVKQLYTVFNQKGLELDEEAEKLRKEDTELFAELNNLADQDWLREQETAREAHQRNREAEARHKEQSNATLRALQGAGHSADGAESSAGKRGAAEQLKKNVEMTRLREEAVRKKRRLDREVDERNATDVEAMRRKRAKKAAESPPPGQAADGNPAEGSAARVVGGSSDGEVLSAQATRSESPPPKPAKPAAALPSLSPLQQQQQQRASPYGNSQQLPAAQQQQQQPAPFAQSGAPPYPTFQQPVRNYPQQQQQFPAAYGYGQQQQHQQQQPQHHHQQQQQQPVYGQAAPSAYAPPAFGQPQPYGQYPAPPGQFPGYPAFGQQQPPPAFPQPPPFPQPPSFPQPPQFGQNPYA
ncbi:hypothetical protein DIPPA_31512 [Diplonema papillatum]|nr:hypothetical protein DIPPA_31512 [Diplonema papillatum]